jgi:hypothetical protein
MACINPNDPEFKKILKEVGGNPLLAAIEFNELYPEETVPEVKPGVEEVFDSNPELASIGTPEQYSQYLDTIFPDSQVKDIVYHGSKVNLTLRNYLLYNRSENFKSISTALWVDGVLDDDRSIIRSLSPEERKKYEKEGKFESGEVYIFKDGTKKYYKNSELDKLYNKGRFEKFRKRDHSYGGLDTFLGTGNYFTTLKKNAEKYADAQLYAAIINVKNAYTEGKGYSNSRSGKGSQELINKGYDAVTEKINYGQEYNVFEPEQIHILGSKQDIKEFKEFVESKSFDQVELDPELSNYLAEQISQAFNVPIPTMEKDTLITADEIDAFNRDVENRDGALPKEYFTGVDDVNKWSLNQSNLYDLVDKDTGEIYLRDVNLSTGMMEKKETTPEPVPEKERQEAIDYINNSVKEFRLDEILAERGYDVNDIISNLASAENKEEFNKIINKLLRLLC